MSSLSYISKSILDFLVDWDSIISIKSFNKVPVWPIILSSQLTTTLFILTTFLRYSNTATSSLPTKDLESQYPIVRRYSPHTTLLVCSFVYFLLWTGLELAQGLSSNDESILLLTSSEFPGYNLLMFLFTIVTLSLTTSLVEIMIKEKNWLFSIPVLASWIFLMYLVKEMVLIMTGIV